MREHTIMTFHVDTLHSLMTAVNASADMVRSHEVDPVSVSFDIEDLGGSCTWLKLVECNTNTRTYYEVRLEKSDG
jgi:hypothetical protein